MMTSTPSYTVFRFSSRVLPQKGRGKAIEELHERGLLRVTKFTPLGEALPHVEFSNRSMPGLRILTGTYAGVRREGVPLGGDHLYFCMTLAGRSLASRRAREMVLSNGDAVLMTSEEVPWSLTSVPR